MKASLIKKELAKAIRYSEKCKGSCDVIAAELQPYFSENISVFEQQADGFVVVYESSHDIAPHNIPVLDVLETLEEDPDFYWYA